MVDEKTSPMTAPNPTTHTEAEREELARLICAAIGFDYDSQLFGKAEWNRMRGEKGGRFHDINEPYQADFLYAADAVFANGYRSSPPNDPE